TEDADRGDNSPNLTLTPPRDEQRRKELNEKIAALEKQLQGRNTPETKPLRDQIAALKKELAAAPPILTPIMRELPEKQRRKTHILVRGNFLDKAAEVQPGVPAVLPSLKAKAPNRLDFARWIVSPENPLTGRVMVNRYWEQIFGIG